MNVFKRNINNIFFIFIVSHLIIWTVVPALTNQNLPLDVIEALAWGSNLDWGFNKHPPGSAFFPEIFFQVFGPQDWAFYLLSQIFVIISFYYVFKLANEIFNNSLLSLISVLILESIFYYNFTSPEFNVNVCQLPFWSIVVYYSWRIYKDENIKFSDCALVGFFAAIGFLSKYLFIYLLASIEILFLYLIFFKKSKKFDFKYLITLEIFVVLLIPHFIWLHNNDYVTVMYGLKRTGLDSLNFFDHIKYPGLFLIKQICLLIPFLVLSWLLIKKFKFQINLKDKKLLFLIVINFLPIFLILLTSIATGSRIRTMWMAPFYLFFGILVVYIFQKQINLNKIKPFLSGFIFLFFLSPILYSYISIKQNDKRTDYPGREIANKVQLVWNQQYNNPINVVLGNEWSAGNLSYHLKSRPSWNGLVTNKNITNLKEYLCIEDICVGYKEDEKS